MKITHPTTLTGIYSIYLCTIRNRGRGQPGPRTAWASACGHFSRMPTEINRPQCRDGVARPFLVSFYVGGHTWAYVGYQCCYTYCCGGQTRSLKSVFFVKFCTRENLHPSMQNFAPKGRGCSTKIMACRSTIVIYWYFCTRSTTLLTSQKKT